MRPGAIASVAGLYLVDRNELAELHHVPINSFIYTVEYLDGSSTTIPESLLELSPD